MKRILIANRGEIAVRLQRTMHKLGIETVAVYHDSEKYSPYVRDATLSCNLGKGNLAETFLNIPRLIEISKQFQCNAIHPGYGFLSENYLFAKACEENNLIFIGPGSEVIRLMSSKTEAKKIALKADIPIVKSVEFTTVQEFQDAHIQYPVIIKAIAGGGGKGIKIVRSANELEQSVESARRETFQYFGDDSILIESYLEDARHIEVQVLGDQFGNMIHLFERECSIQRNHQKLIEESPAISIRQELKNKLYKTAIRFATELNYTGAGTIEFLLHGNDFYFLEMNTRIQVEHPVTEMVTGIDIVEEQINIAKGLPLSEKLKDITISGHAIEVRICAENPYKDYRPSTGNLVFTQFPSNVRVDTFVENNTVLTPYFDSMIAKVIVHGKNRNEAITLMSDALNNTTLHGVETNLEFIRQVLEHAAYQKNEISTNFLNENLDLLLAEYVERRNQIDKQRLAIAFILINFQHAGSPKSTIWKELSSETSHPVNCRVDNTHFNCQLNKTREFIFVKLDEKEFKIRDYTTNGNVIEFILNNEQLKFRYTQIKQKSYDLIEHEGIIFRVSSIHILRMALLSSNESSYPDGNSTNRIVSPLYGKIIEVKVRSKDRVKKGDVLISIDSMKTENNILAPFEGIIETIFVKQGAQVRENVELLTMNPIS